jgi:hypothetical protein
MPDHRAAPRRCRSLQRPWQRDLGVAHSCVGDIYQAQGRLDLALDAFKEYQTISQRLAAADPWRRSE